MADTLESIYLNTSLGATELDDGEHTILTTNSTTRYVLKDAYVNGTSSFTNTYLELNGFNVGSLTSNLNGSLIIPPNSTLKIKSTDYPVSFIEERSMVGLNTNGSAVMYRYYNSDGDEVGTPKYGYTGNSTDQNGQVQDMMLNTVNGTDYLYYTTTDLNSDQRLYVVNPAQEYNVTYTTTNLKSEVYKPIGISRNSYYGKVAVNINGGQLRYLPLDTSPTGTSYTTPSSFGSGSINNSYTGTSSSYPMGYADHGYYWYVSNNASPAFLYGVNLQTGVQVRLTLSTWNFNNGSGGEFVIAHRKSDDKFILYHWYNTTNVAQGIFKMTKATLDAVTTNTNYNSTDSWVSHDLVSWINTPKSTYASSTVLSYDENGNVGFQDSQAYIRYQDTSGTEVQNSTVQNMAFPDGRTNTSDSRIFARRRYALSGTEATAAGLSAPTFGVQLLGIKSEA